MMMVVAVVAIQVITSSKPVGEEAGSSGRKAQGCGAPLPHPVVGTGMVTGAGDMTEMETGTGATRGVGTMREGVMMTTGGNMVATDRRTGACIETEIEGEVQGRSIVEEEATEGIGTESVRHLQRGPGQDQDHGIVAVTAAGAVMTGQTGMGGCTVRGQLGVQLSKSLIPCVVCSDAKFVFSTFTPVSVIDMQEGPYWAQG
jgi:hypothetical protein